MDSLSLYLLKKYIFGEHWPIDEEYHSIKDASLRLLDVSVWPVHVDASLHTVFEDGTLFLLKVREVSAYKMIVASTLIGYQKNGGLVLMKAVSKRFVVYSDHRQGYSKKR